MDERSQQEFDRIAALPPESLTKVEADFLYARRTYLNKRQREDFGDVIRLKEQRVADEATADANEKAEPTGRGAAARPVEGQSTNDTAKQTPEKPDVEEDEPRKPGRPARV